MDKFMVLEVAGLSPSEIEMHMNELAKLGYQRVFQSNIEWYQAEGFDGIICFELKEKVEVVDITKDDIVNEESKKSFGIRCNCCGKRHYYTSMCPYCDEGNRGN